MDSIQYTLRGITPAMDKELRQLAKRSGRSLNTVTLEVLQVGIGLKPLEAPNHDLDDLFGKLGKPEAQRLSQASRELRTIDKKDW